MVDSSGVKRMADPVREGVINGELVQKLLDVSLKMPFERVVSPLDLPVRYLGPGRLIDLFQLYQATCCQSRVPCASLRTFSRCWHKGWKQVLRFRKRSTHTACSVCDKLRTAIRRARCWRDQVTNQVEYLRHLQAQWADRQTYWGLRTRAVCLTQFAPASVTGYVNESGGCGT